MPGNGPGKPGFVASSGEAPGGRTPLLCSLGVQHYVSALALENTSAATDCEDTDSYDGIAPDARLTDPPYCAGSFKNKLRAIPCSAREGRWPCDVENGC